MGLSIKADWDKEMDGQVKLHRSRYRIGRGWVGKGDKVLDLGCGQAYGTELLSRVAKEVIGFDMDKPQIKWNKETYKDLDNIKFIHGNLEAINIPEADVAVSFEVIEHLYKPADFITKLKKKIKKFIIVSVPIGEELVEVNGDIQAVGDSTHHSNFPTSGHLDRMFIDKDWSQMFGFQAGVTYIAVYYNKNQ